MVKSGDDTDTAHGSMCISKVGAPSVERNAMFVFSDSIWAVNTEQNSILEQLQFVQLNGSSDLCVACIVQL